MTVVDSSVWIEFLAGRQHRETDWLKEQAESSLCIPDLVLLEILQGIRQPATFDRIRDSLLSFTVVETTNQTSCIAAARNYRLLRQRGLTVRSTVDVLIATFCIAEGYSLLHRDRDFDHFERELGLRIIRP